MDHKAAKVLSKTGFRAQLVLIFTIGILFTAVISSLATSELSRLAVRDRFIDEGKQVTESFASQSTLALLYQSAENARDLADTMLAFPDIQGVAVFDPEHKVILSMGEAGFAVDHENLWPGATKLVAENPRAWLFAAPVYREDPEGEAADSPFIVAAAQRELIGFVHVTMGKGTLQALTGNIVTTNFVVSTAIAAVLLALLIFLTNRMTRPLSRLAATMRRAEQGEENLRAEIRGPKDITNMQAAFNTMMEVLEARRRDLVKARDAALESARIKGEFAAHVTHEIRTPLNGVIGMLELLQHTELTARQREYLEVSRNSGDALLSLVNDILDFSKNEAGKLRLNQRDFYLQETMDDVVNLVACQAQRKGLELGYVMDPEIPLVLHGDPDRIRQVLINLVGNALKFTKQGQIVMEARTLEQQQDRVLLEIEVRDTGIGMEEAALKHIFSPFSQVDSSTTREHGGTGLGLTICRQLVEIMGGEIGVQSEPGEGSTFRVVLPLAKPEQITEQLKINTASVAGLRALIVDAKVINRSVLEQIFRTWGMYFRSVGAWAEARDSLHAAAAEGRAFDVVFVDEGVLGEHAQRIVRETKEDPILSPARIVVLSSAGSYGVAGEIAGVAASLEKPIRATRLFDCITKVLRKSPDGAQPPADIGQLLTELPGRVLLVEDNRANQQVAIGMLEALGCAVETVCNGFEAVEAVVQDDYDLIIMDCNMPGMDGYEATRRIRDLEKSGARTAIMAMTANVQQGEDDKCRAAGMDDYIEKPLRLEILREKLRRWLPGYRGEKHRQQVAADIGGEPAPADGDPPLDQALIRELRPTIGEAFYRMIKVFLEDIPVQSQMAREALARGDMGSLINVAHSIKGGAMNVGARRLIEACRKIEQMAGGSAVDARELLKAVIAEAEVAAVALKRELATAGEHDVGDQHEQARVLIADDDRAMRIGLGKALELDGHHILEAENGFEAVALCRKAMPDLILMDAVMPIVDGFKACAQIRKSAAGEDIPILIITGLEDEHAIERAFAAGATDYISKPVNFSVLRRRIDRLLHAVRAEKVVRHLAYNDALTGLPNRVQFAKHLRECIARASAANHLLAVLFLDLDRFKMVNDSLGHAVGDLLLKVVAERIRICVRRDDMVARLGGDEFTVVLQDIRSDDMVFRIAENICHELSKPFVFMDHEVFVTTSIGISIYPRDGIDIGSLMKHADTAMFCAKEQGAQYRCYEDGMEMAIANRMAMEADLRRALNRNEFVVYYQPQKELASGRIVGMEALVRWQHPERGLVPPNDFIPIAEETGLIEDIGEWVLKDACVQLQAWLQMGLGPLRVAVNLSGRQLESGDLVETLARVLADTGLAPHALELEITESMLMDCDEKILPALRNMREMGITLAIDDFGTGYSSLGKLRRFPIDILKIDRTFVSDITNEAEDVTIIAGIIALAKSLDLKVVAEGVENSAQEEYLRERQCDLIQGYHLGRPVPAAVFEQQFLRQGENAAKDNGKVTRLPR